MSCPMGRGGAGDDDDDSAAGAAQQSGAQRRLVRGDGQYYHAYLQLDKLLDAQAPRAPAAHDEMLFIVVHQAYELWFKQLLYELDSVAAALAAPFVDDAALGVAVRRAERMVAVLELLVAQVDLVETITPLDFLDFRDYLVPASGFQSLQFRLLEMRLGLRADDRNAYQRKSFTEYFSEQHAELLRRTEAAADQPTLFDALNAWLERTPFTRAEGFDWRAAFAAAVHAMLDADAATIRANPLFEQAQRDLQLSELESTRSSFAVLLEEARYAAAEKRWARKLSFGAVQAALMMFLYRDEPMFQTPFRLLTALSNIDELLTRWRHRHSMMVYRMIGNKLGTGGSSGFGYLRSTTGEKYRVFGQLSSLSTYLIPRSALPPLPAALHQSLGFSWSNSAEARQRAAASAAAATAASSTSS